MKIRDIIKRATPGPWHWDEWGTLFSGDTEVIRSPYYELQIEPGVANFIATFDPEHIALMEAEIQSAREAYDIRSERGLGSLNAFRVWLTARAALDTYRKERGLDA